MTTSSITSHRSLHLVDLENLVGDPRAEAAIALATFRAYLSAVRWQPGDHVIVATNPWLKAKIAFDLPAATSRHALHGRDGADTMLLALAPPELVVKRYGHLVVGSGDGIFASRAQMVHERGITVDVVARRGGCSGRLRRFTCAFLEPITDDVVLAAAMPTRKRRAKPCPHCGSRNTTRIVYGLYAPGPEGMPDHIVFGGCTIFPGQPLRHCLDCDRGFEPREGPGEWPSQ